MDALSENVHLKYQVENLIGEIECLRAEKKDRRVDSPRTPLLSRKNVLLDSLWGFEDFEGKGVSSRTLDTGQKGGDIKKKMDNSKAGVMASGIPH
jgi:hypothetical protein